MAKKMLIDATHAEETRVVVVDGNKVDEFDFETANRRQLSGNIYLAKVTRVEPSLQAAFVDYGGNRHGFLAFAEIHPDYYQIPVADREALREEERAYAAAQSAEENGRGARAKPAATEDTASATDDVPGMTVVEPEGDTSAADAGDAAAGANGAESATAPYAAVDHAAELDDQIESVADEDVSDEVRGARKPRPRRYKIQEVIKVRQILLVQVVKEERGNKGAALTTYLSLAGRYCVLMPNTARGGGISRKITNAPDRKKLKEIAGLLVVPEGAGLIIRTAGAQRTKAEIKRDYEYLMRLWEQIRELTLKSIAPAPIYEEGNLIKRAIRDLYNREIDEVWVEGAEGYRVAKDFMKMIMPSHARHVKHYTEELPLFARYQVESYLASMFSPTVQLKSGGYIVIGVTEALVAIDINSGRATKEGSIEETALKTNLEASDEIARQLRLRDLAGLIVIDFIDMEERKNNAAVEKRLKERLKSDRARIQVGRISGFGLLEMSRQRLRPGMIEATTQPCPHCHGTGILRSDDSLALSIIRQLEEEGTRKRSAEVLLKAPVSVVNFLVNSKREHIAHIEARYGMAVRMEADPSLVSPDFKIEKFRTATRPVGEAAPVVSVDSTAVNEAEPAEEAAPADEAAPAEAETAATSAGDGGPPKKKRRRRSRGRRSSGSTQQANGGNGAEAPAEPGASGQDGEAAPEVAGAQDSAATEQPAAAEAHDAAAASDAGAADAPAEAAGPKRSRRSRRKPRSGARGGEAAPEQGDSAAAQDAAPADNAAAQAPAPAEAESAPSADGAPAAAKAPPAPVAEAPQAAEEAAEPPHGATPEATADETLAEPEAEPAEMAQASAQPAEAAPSNAPQTQQAPDNAEEEKPRPRRRGWWAIGRS